MGERREIKGFCTFCRSRCGSVSVVEDGRLVAVRPDPGHPTGKALCAKGRAAPEIVHSTERLTTPLRRTTPKTAADPGWAPVSWEAALDDIAGRMRAIADAHGPEAVAFGMTSASAASISDARAWLERFIWGFGSPNICASAELCNWHKDHTHALTFGRGISTPDYANTDLAVLWGHNPSHVWLAEAEALGAARARGAGLVVIDPRRTPFAAQADLWLRVRPGTDGLLAAAVARLMLERGLFDEAFVRAWTNGPLLVRQDTGRFLRAAEVGLGPGDQFVTLDAATRAAEPYDPARAAQGAEARRFALEGEALVGGIRARPAFALYREALERITLGEAAQATGLAASDIEAFAERLGAARRACYYAWTGLGQHANATQTDRAVATLFALKGQVDAPGGNVAWAGPPSNPVDDMSLLAPAQRAKTLGLAERPLGPASRSWITAGDLYRAILEGDPYPVRAFVAFGSNPLASRSDPERGRRAFERLDLQVHCDVFENPTAATADYLLPVNSAWEREGLRVGFEIDAEAQRRVQLRPAMIPPVGESRSDFWIAAELARRLGVGGVLFDGNLDAAHDHVLAPTGITTADLLAAGGALDLPTPPSLFGYAQETPAGVRGFATPTRRVELYSERLARIGQPAVPAPTAGEAASPAFPLVLTNGKFGHFCHSQHRQIAGLRARSPDPLVSLSPEAGAERGVADGDAVEVRSAHGAMRATARIDPHLADDAAVGEFGWWQACDDLGAPGYPLCGADSPNYNLLPSTALTDPGAHSPAFRSTRCEVVRRPDLPARWTGFAELETARVEAVTDSVTAVTLRRPGGGALPGFRPGQFISVQLDGVARSYSLIGPADSAPRSYEIAVKREPMGALSPRMAQLGPGDRLGATVPAGRFTLPLQNRRPVVLVAFGIGVTPFVGLLRTLAAQGQGPETWVFHCAPSPQAQPFRDELVAGAAAAGVTLRSLFTRTPQAGLPQDAARGRLTAGHIPQDLIARRARFYLCGGPEALAQVREGLLARGVPPFEIFQERFVSPRAVADDAACGPVSLRLARSGRTAAWAGQGSVLDALLAAGVPAPSGCRVGQCESCAVRLLEGEVVYAEAPEGLEDGVCLPCIARPLSDLVLDA